MTVTLTVSSLEEKERKILFCIVGQINGLPRKVLKNWHLSIWGGSNIIAVAFTIYAFYFFFCGFEVSFYKCFLLFCEEGLRFLHHQVLGVFLWAAPAIHCVLSGVA